MRGGSTETKDMAQNEKERGTGGTNGVCLHVCVCVFRWACVPLYARESHVSARGASVRSQLTRVEVSTGCWPAGYCMRSYPSGAPDSHCHLHYYQL